MTRSQLRVACVKDVTGSQCRRVCLEAIAAGVGEELCLSEPKDGQRQVTEFKQNSSILTAEMLCCGREPSLQGIEQLLEGGAAVVPSIKHEQTCEQGHAVVAIEVTANHVRYMDPCDGRCKSVDRATFECWRLTKPPQERSRYLEAVVVRRRGEARS